MSEEPLRQRIGIYGGTFDPIHNGHLKVAEAILKAFALDRMLFVVSAIPPHKRKQAIGSPFHRLAMVALATADSPQMFASTVELESPSRPYTIETLERLRMELQPVQLFFVMGADSFKEVASWYEYERILSEYDVIVATRPGYRNDENIAANLAPQLQSRVVDLRGGRYPSGENLAGENLAGENLAGADLAGENIQSPHIFLTDYVEVDVSATGIREAVAQGRSIDDLVPPPVESYIEKYKLYRKS